MNNIFEKIHTALFIIWLILMSLCILALPVAVCYDFHKIGLVGN